MVKTEPEDNVSTDDFVWKIIDTYFRSNPDYLVKHHIDTYDDFFQNGLPRILKEKNPIHIQQTQDPDTKEFYNMCDLWIGGKNGDALYYGKPVIYDDNGTSEGRAHYMYPNEARLRNMTYGFAIHYDVLCEFSIKKKGDAEYTKHSITLEKLFLGRFPIMLQSYMCILKGMSPEARYALGECRNDVGGYFIINGKEKNIIPQEKFADNTLYIRDNYNDDYSYSAEIRTVSEDASKPERTLSVRIFNDQKTQRNGNIVVNIPNVRAPVPLFIVFRALGIISDKDIIRFCLLNIEANETMLELFRSSIYDAGMIYTQQQALAFIATLTKRKTLPSVMHILSDYFLPNVGELNFRQKAYQLGYIVYRLLLVYTKMEKPTDRDNFKYKRVETAGALLYDIFKEYYTLQQKYIYQEIDKKYYYGKASYENNFVSLIEANTSSYFNERITETGIRKAFKGSWGAEEHTKRVGVVQDLNRLSFNSALSQLRKLNLPLDSSSKLAGPRHLNNTQWGIIDPLDTPDGGNIGTHKHLAMTTHITRGCSGYPYIKWFRREGMMLLDECEPELIFNSTKVFVNGVMVGAIATPREVVKKFITYRRCGILPIYTSINWNIKHKEILIYSDSGRLTRPIFHIDDETKHPSYERHMSRINKLMKDGKLTWAQLVVGFSENRAKFPLETCEFLYEKYHEIEDVVPIDEAPKDITNKMLNEAGIIEYLDTQETESALIAMTHAELEKAHMEKKHVSATHVEIHPSLIMGVMGNQIVFPENNQLPRDMFSCGQSKQAVSLYHSNYHNRIDKMGVILNYGEVPLVKTRYLEYINKERHPYGENAVVAIMSYNGYNVEDALLFNEGSIKRGLFRTTYFTSYEAYEEKTDGEKPVITQFANIEKSAGVVGLKIGHDYSHLDDTGLIKDNTPMDDKTIIMGMYSNDPNDPSRRLDASITTKKGQLGFVDRSFMTQDEEGYRLAKVRIREERYPSLGDKFCSRAGQKGTCGLIIPEEDMPFTKDGIRPDIIVNPHALPSRMTIGQLVESLMGKACVHYGGCGDCTAFVNKGPTNNLFGDMLTDIGFNNTGNEVLYNGFTGEQCECNIYIGPTYYLRLKHMVKDKVNYRARGPRTAMTRQPVHGRANDGGLRIGEMERDGILGHGMSAFLMDSMLNRGDEYYMAVCNNTGTIAIYNETKNLFLSPFADGPIKFNGIYTDAPHIENVTRYGRDFSIVRVPYCFKLLMHELQTMNIQMRIITEANVEKLTALGFSGRELGSFVNPENLRTEVNKEILRRAEMPNALKSVISGTTTDLINQRIEENRATMPTMGELEEEAIEEEEVEKAQNRLTIGEEVAMKVDDIVEEGASSIANGLTSVANTITGAVSSVVNSVMPEPAEEPKSMLAVEEEKPAEEDVQNVTMNIESASPPEEPAASKAEPIKVVKLG